MRTVALAVAIALLAPAPGAKVELKPLRRVTQLAVGKCQALVMFSLRIADGGQADYYCPKVVWEWEDGSRSMEQSDCVPFEQAAAADHLKAMSRSRTFTSSGTFRIAAHICQGERRIKTVETTATIAGWDGFPDEMRANNGCPASHASVAQNPDELVPSTDRTMRLKDPCKEEQ
jgi:hypothetical protein